jgi:hypothetical protein
MQKKRDKRTFGRKKRLGGTFPGKRHSRCPFISAIFTSPMQSSFANSISALITFTDPIVARDALLSYRLPIHTAMPIPNGNAA